MLSPEGKGVTAVHAPITVYPSPFPESAMANALAVQTAFDELMVPFTDNEKWLEDLLLSMCEFFFFFSRSLAYRQCLLEDHLFNWSKQVFSFFFFLPDPRQRGESAFKLDSDFTGSCGNHIWRSRPPASLSTWRLVSSYRITLSTNTPRAIKVALPSSKLSSTLSRFHLVLCLAEFLSCIHNSFRKRHLRRDWQAHWAVSIRLDSLAFRRFGSCP